MISRQVCAGNAPPVMVPAIGVLSSLPNQTLPTRLPVKALNQALVELLVVPVLPEITRPGIWRPRPVPSVTHVGHDVVHLGDLVGRKHAAPAVRCPLACE